MRARLEKKKTLIEFTARAQRRIDKVGRLVKVARQVERDGIVGGNAEELHADVLVIRLRNE